MTCYYPLQGWRSREVGPSGKRPIVFKESEGYSDLPVKLPCGQCVGCRLERSRQWAIRCVHEASMHDENSFITLTYNDESLPVDRCLKLSDFQKFMKRLRKHFEPRRIKFFHCGEYGEENYRPHYHACLFGVDFEDRVFHKVTKSGSKLYTSETLDKLWSVDGQLIGWASVGDVTFESAAYVARYIMKKVTGDMAEDHYTIVNLETGEWYSLSGEPEYTTMSNGLGKSWLEKFGSDVYPNDMVVLRGKRMRPPKYYDRCVDEKLMRSLKGKRVVNAKQHASDQTPERLGVREKCQLARLKRLPRNLED